MSEPPASESPAAPSAPARAPAATGAGRGVLYIAFAKIYFILAGFVFQAKVAAILSRATFGAFNVVNSVVSLFNNVAVTGTIQAVSRFTAQEPDKAREVQHAGLRMHLFVGLPVAIAFVAAAPLVAWFFHDPGKTVPIMLAGVIIGGYSFYAVFVGTANGLRAFNRQAGLDVTFATVRVAAMLAMGMLGLGVVGVVGGWVAAVGVILLASVAAIGLPRLPAGAPRLPVRTLLGFFGPVAVYLLLFNGPMFVDTWLLKRFATEHFAAAGATGGAAALDRALPWARPLAGYGAHPSALADTLIAHYAAAQYIARLCYQLIIAATFVVFPLVSRSTFTEDREATRRYVEVTARYSLVFAAALATVMAALPAPLLGLIYAPDLAAAGAPVLPTLAAGHVGFSMLAIAGTILNGAGRTRAAIATAAITLAVAAVGNLVAIPLQASGEGMLVATAAVTSGAMLVGAASSAWACRAALGAFLPWASLLRVAAAAAVAIAAGRALPVHGKLVTLAAAAAVGLVFLGVLVATGELGRRDLAAIRAVRQKRGGGGGEP